MMQRPTEDETSWQLVFIVASAVTVARDDVETCSVMRTEKLRYFLLMLVPSVTKRMRKTHSVRHHMTSSQLPR